MFGENVKSNLKDHIKLLQLSSEIYWDQTI